MYGFILGSLLWLVFVFMPLCHTNVYTRTYEHDMRIRWMIHRYMYVHCKNTTSICVCVYAVTTNSSWLFVCLGKGFHFCCVFVCIYVPECVFVCMCIYNVFTLHVCANKDVCYWYLWQLCIPSKDLLMVDSCTKCI